MTKTCPTCDLPHVPPENSRARTCLPCWKLAQSFDLTKSDEAHQRLALHTRKLAAESESLATQVAKLREEVASLRARASQPAAAQPLAPDLLKTLISLCHPDRHGGSATATAATQALIAMRAPR